MRLKFNVSGDRIKILNSRELYSGNTLYRCNFMFSAEWEGLLKFAVFIKDGKDLKVAIEDDGCKIPGEVLDGVFSIGVFGTNAEEKVERISSNLIYIESAEGAYRQGEEPSKEVLSIWEQYVSRCEEEKKECKAYSEAAEAAAGSAEKQAIEALKFSQDAEEYKVAAGQSAEVATSQAEAAQGFKEDAEAAKEDSISAKEGAEFAMVGAEAAEGRAAEFSTRAEDAATAADSSARVASESETTAQQHKEDAEAAAARAEAAAENFDDEKLVHKVGDEVISGNKTFTGDVMLNRIDAIMPEGGDGSGYIRLEAGTIANAYAALGIYSGAKIEAYLDWDNMYDDPEHNGNRLALSGKVLINGKEAATKEDIEKITTPEIDESNLVHKDGDEEIAGIKTFSDGVKTSYIVGNGDHLLIIADGITLESGSPVYVNTNRGFWINGKEAAVKEDITPIALREVSTHNADTNSHSDIRIKLDTIEAVAEGASVSETFESYAEMVSALNEADKNKYKKGRNINIITVGVPDLWVAYVSDASAAYNYTTDEAFVEELKASGTIQVGYFKLAMLETQKVDLADYAKKEDVASALGGCIFKQVSQEEYDAMFAEGTLLADVIYIVGGNANAS